MCVRKRDVQNWTGTLHGGKPKAAETLAWELAARGEAARVSKKFFTAAFLDCSKCYERVDQKLAHDRAVASGCSPIIANLAMDMYARDRIVQVHGSHSETVEVNRGMLAGCGFAVHFLKAIIVSVLESSPVEAKD